jgi:hypothetical protein
MIENKQQRPILIASFSDVFSGGNGIRSEIFCIEAERDRFPAGI